MSYLTMPENHLRSWESSPTLTPGSVSSLSSNSYDYEESDIKERKGFLSSEQKSFSRHLLLPNKVIVCLTIVVLTFLFWSFTPVISRTRRQSEISPAIPFTVTEIDIIPATPPVYIQAGTQPEPLSTPPELDIEPANLDIQTKPEVESARLEVKAQFEKEQQQVDRHVALEKQHVLQKDQKKEHDMDRKDHYMEDISRFFKEVRLDNPDGLAFSQMGFRTRLYAHMLQEEQQNLTKFADRERNMWFFLPGIETIRKRSQTRQADGRPTRGIVLSADTSRFVYTCHFLAMLREYHKSTLPVEIFYFGDSELPKSMREHLTLQYNDTTVELSKDELFDDSFAKIAGYAVKLYALLATSFSEVLMADADTVLLASPEAFFGQEGYKNRGTLFFQDRYVTHYSESGHDFVVQQMGRRNVSESLSQTPFWTQKLKHLQESGVIVVDRSRPEVFAALLFTARQNGKLMRDTVLDRHFWGDKESFWMAFELADFPYYMVNQSCGAIGQEHAEFADPKQGFCTEHPLHFFDNQNEDGLPDPAGNNRTLGKPAWFNGSLRLNKYNGEKKLLDPTDDTIFVMNGTWTYYDVL